MDFSTIADWMTILFFLWFGLKTLIPALDNRTSSLIGGVIALAASFPIFIDRSPKAVMGSKARRPLFGTGFLIRILQPHFHDRQNPRMTIHFRVSFPYLIHPHLFIKTDCIGVCLKLQEPVSALAG